MNERRLGQTHLGVFLIKIIIVALFYQQQIEVIQKFGKIVVCLLKVNITY